MLEFVAEAIKHLKPFRGIPIMPVLSKVRVYSVYSCFSYNCHLCWGGLPFFFFFFYFFYNGPLVQLTKAGLSCSAATAL